MLACVVIKGLMPVLAAFSVSKNMKLAKKVAPVGPVLLQWYVA